MTTLKEKLAALGHELPALGLPAANYLHHRSGGGLLAIAGQIGPAGAAQAGVVGDGVDLATAQAQARVAGLRLLAAIDAALGGDIERVVQVLRVGVFVAAARDFGAHGAVADGVSDLLQQVFGERGRHARAAIGVASLPAGALVEVDALLQVAP